MSEIGSIKNLNLTDDIGKKTINTNYDSNIFLEPLKLKTQEEVFGDDLVNLKPKSVDT